MAEPANVDVDSSMPPPPPLPPSTGPTPKPRGGPPPQLLLKTALNYIARTGRDGCLVKRIWKECNATAPDDAGIRGFVWRGICQQADYVFCVEEADLVVVEPPPVEPGPKHTKNKHKKREMKQRRTLTPAALAALPPARLDAEVLVVASEAHRFRALGVISSKELPEEPYMLDMMEILALSTHTGLSGTEMDAEIKRRQLPNLSASFLIDRLVGQGHVKKMARLVYKGGPGNKRVLYSRLDRFSTPFMGDLVRRVRTGDRVVDHARSCLYGDAGKQIAQILTEHYSGLERSRPRPASAPLDEVARLLRLDGPTAEALIRAMQHRDFDDRAALRALPVVVGAGGDDAADDDEESAAATSLGGQWQVYARPPTSGGTGATSSSGEVTGVKGEDDEEAGPEGGEGVEEAGLGPWRRPLCPGNIVELDEMRQIYRLTLLRAEKGVSVPDVERLLGMGNKRANKLLTMIVSNGYYGVCGMKVTHGRTAAYRLYAASCVPEGERMAAASVILPVARAGGGGAPVEPQGRVVSVLEMLQQAKSGEAPEEDEEEEDVVAGGASGSGTAAGDGDARRDEKGAFATWHKTFTGLRRVRMELTYQEVQRCRCMSEVDLARFLRFHDKAKATKMDRKSVRRLLGDLEEQSLVRLVAVNVPNRRPALVVALPGLEPEGREIQAVIQQLLRPRPSAGAYRGTTSSGRRLSRVPNVGGGGGGGGGGGKRRLKREEEDDEDTPDDMGSYDGEDDDEDEEGEHQEGDEEEEEEVDDSGLIDKKTLRMAEQELHVLEGIQRVEFFHRLLWQHAQTKLAAEEKKKDATAAQEQEGGDGKLPPTKQSQPINLTEVFQGMTATDFVRVFGLDRIGWTYSLLGLLKKHVQAGTLMKDLPAKVLSAFFLASDGNNAWSFRWRKVLGDLLGHLAILRLAVDDEQEDVTTGQWAVVGKHTFTRQFQIDMGGPNADGGKEKEEVEEEQEQASVSEVAGDSDVEYPWMVSLGVVHVKFQARVMVRRARHEAEGVLTKFEFDFSRMDMGLDNLKRYWSTLKTLALQQTPPPPHMVRAVQQVEGGRGRGRPTGHCHHDPPGAPAQAAAAHHAAQDLAGPGRGPLHQGRRAPAAAQGQGQGHGVGDSANGRRRRPGRGRPGRGAAPETKEGSGHV